MELHRALLERRTIHAYERTPVPDDVIERGLRAAVHAPIHRLTFPWRFTRVGRETRESIAELAVRLKRKPDCAMPAEQERRIRDKIQSPHELIVVSLARTDDPVIAREDYASAACAIQNLCLSLYDDGIGSKWSTGKVITHPDTYATLGIDPTAEEIIGFVWVGKSAATPSVPERPTLDQLVRRLP